MNITSYYPVLMTRDVAATAAFYQRHFGFEPLFTAHWYVHLQSREAGPAVSLAILDGRHETVPQAGRGQVAAGALLNFEVDDVDAEYDRLRAAGLQVRPVCPAVAGFIKKNPDYADLVPEQFRDAIS